MVVPGSMPNIILRVCVVATNYMRWLKTFFSHILSAIAYAHGVEM